MSLQEQEVAALRAGRPDRARACKFKLRMTATAPWFSPVLASHGRHFGSRLDVRLGQRCVALEI